MAVNSLIGDPGEDPDGDATALTRLAAALAARNRELCTLKTFYDGQEKVPTDTLPPNTGDKASRMYQDYVELARLDLARPIADAVSQRQKPNGFRLVGDKTKRSTEADDMWKSARMPLTATDMFRDVSKYGASYALVTATGLPSRVTRLSPWVCITSEDEQSALVYAYDENESKEHLILYRLLRAEDGSVDRIYSRVATRDADQRTLVAEEDKEGVYTLANTKTARPPAFQTGFAWDGEKSEDGYEFAKTCGTLPVVRMASHDGAGQFEPHLSTLRRIDQELFQRLCIASLQAFRQRAVKNLPSVYSRDDPEVRAGNHKAGDRIDYSSIFTQGPNALWLLPKEAEIWESKITEITPFLSAVKDDVKYLAASSNTPLDILSPDVQGSAEGASLKREGLIAKVEENNTRADDAFVRIMRLALTADGNTQAVNQQFETVWLPINPPNILEQAQAAAAASTSLPTKTQWRLIWGMSEAEIAEAEADMVDMAFQQSWALTRQAMDGQLIQDQTLPAQTGGLDHGTQPEPIPTPEQPGDQEDATT